MINASDYNNFYESHRSSGLDCISASIEWMNIVFDKIASKREERRLATLAQFKEKKRKEVPCSANQSILIS